MLLKRWFGDEAGKRRGKHQVLQTRTSNGDYSWKPMLPWKVTDETGVELDCRFEYEYVDGEPTIVIHSRSGQPVQNSQYERALEVLLERLAGKQVKITRIEIASRYTRKLPSAQRAISPNGLEFPIDIAQFGEFSELRRRIGHAAAAKKKPGAKGGNSTKRLRIWLDRKVDEETLAGGD